MVSKHWYFTFGPNHLDGKGSGKYVEIWGNVDYEQARAIMWALFDAHWAFQYTEEEFLHTRTKLVRHMLITIQEG